MGMPCPWCKYDMPYNADVCPHCTRSRADHLQQHFERQIPRIPPSNTLPCHACGAWIPLQLFGDSRQGDQPGNCPACSSPLDEAVWYERAKRPRRCNCGIGRCWSCDGRKGAWRGLLWWSKWVPCEICKGSGTCNACKGTFVIQRDYR